MSLVLLAMTTAVACGSDQTGLAPADSTPPTATIEPETSPFSTTTTSSSNPSGTNAPTSTPSVEGPLHEWVRRNSQFGTLVTARDSIRYSMDHGGPGLAEGLDGCVTVASDLADRSATDAVIPDQTKLFGDVAAACSSMVTAASSGDAAALAAGRTDLESKLDSLKEIFNAFEEVMMYGDSNETIETTQTT
jgi:hypothetical protein